jgi:hypothetical protein
MLLHKRGWHFGTGKEQSDSSFLFFTNKFISFFISKMNTKEKFVEKLQRRSRERL